MAATAIPYTLLRSGPADGALDEGCSVAPRHRKGLELRPHERRDARVVAQVWLRDGLELYDRVDGRREARVLLHAADDTGQNKLLKLHVEIVGAARGQR